MNIHVPQSEQTKAEIQELMMIEKNIVSTQNNKPVIGVIQDALLGTFKITSRDTFISEEVFMNIMMKLKNNSISLPEPTIYKPKKLWTGKQVFDLILPKINFHRFTPNHTQEDKKSFSIDDTEVIIRKGKLVSGQLCKKSIGASEGGIIHIIWLDYSPTHANDFISQTQYLINCWLQTSGFSIGAGDIFANNESLNSVSNIVKNAKEKVNQIIKIGQRNNLKPESYESKINQVLNNAVSQTGREIEKNTTLKNNIKTTVTGGSKGSILNIAQIMGCVGQQNVAGQRIDLGYTKRVLPHFERNDITPEAKGFVENSYEKGLEPYEFYYHAMGGREGVIDTACKSVTGDTPIIIDSGKKCQRVTIGEWIDKQLLVNKDQIKYYDEKNANMELLNIQNKSIKIPSTDKYGNITWENIINITRHDPSEMIYVIETKFGRKVKVVESKSLLILNEETNTYEPKDSQYVKVGDKVPVTKLLNVTNSLNTINLSEYLSKSEFIYGTDFNIAIKLVHNSLPRFWWKENNGKTFHLPYKHVHTILRAKNRSNIYHIKDSYIYPYSGKRTEAEIPEKLDLNYDNGLFIGLYLAEGNSHIKSGKVCIANNDENIQTFVKKWFDNMKISHKIYTKFTVGKSTTIQGYNTLLAKILNQLVGDSARSKKIPYESINAPDEFIYGLLDGYISGDGYISENSIEVGSASLELIEGISMLLTRIGIFSSIAKYQITKNNFNTKDIAPTYRLSIRSKYAVKFAENINLISNEKHKKMKLLLTRKSITKYIKNYNEQIDTINDEIISIEKIPSHVFGSKVYDLTVENTLNFSLANGLHVYDTSESGYIQRRLVKAMEDLQIHSDKTMRNSIGDVVQFVFGQDGMDSTYLISERYELWDSEIEFKNKFVERSTPKDELNIIRNIKETTKTTQFKSPVHITRMLETIQMNYSNKYEKLSPKFIFEEVQKLLNSLTLHNNKNDHYNEINNYANKQLCNLIQIKCATKQIRKVYKLTKEAYNDLIQQIKFEFQRSIIQTGDMVGTTSAQSLGETVTQLTLNTFHNAGNSAKNVTLGVPRLKEIINVSKNIKSPGMILPLKNEYNTKEYAEKIASEMEFTKFLDVVKSFKVISSNNMNQHSQIYFDFLNEYNDEYCEYKIEFELSSENLIKKNLSVLDVSIKIMETYENDILVCHNNENCDKILIDIYIVKKEEMENINIERYIRVFAHKIQHECIIQGLSDITQTYINSNNNNWFIETDGTNINSFLNNEYFDYINISTNDIMDVYETLGIEAARKLLLHELRKVIEFDGTYVNVRHFLTLVDTMTYKGDIMAITRHGINKSNTGPLMKCSFEETVDVLTDAAVFSEKDNLKGVTENIMVGKMSDVGTGNIELYYDLFWSECKCYN